MNQPENTGAGGEVVRMPRQRETIVVQSMIPTLDTAMFEHMQRIATMMAQSSLVPAHLNMVKKVDGKEVEISAKEAIANCFLVVNQAIRWGMDPFAAAQSAYTTKGKLGWEGKMIAAVINSHPLIEERLSYTYSGTGEQRKVIVSAKLKGEKEPRTVEGTVAAWRTNGTGSPWDKQSQWDQQLSYRGAREWGRRHLPEAMLGVYGDDEIAHFEATERTLAHEQPQLGAPTRGPAGLKAALNGKGEVADAELVPAGADKTAEPPKPPAQAEAAPATPPAAKTPQPAADEQSTLRTKAEGTPEKRDDFVRRFREAKNMEKLDLDRDQANAYSWTKPDMEVLTGAYTKRKEELEL